MEGLAVLGFCQPTTSRRIRDTWSRPRPNLEPGPSPPNLSQTLANPKMYERNTHTHIHTYNLMVLSHWIGGKGLFHSTILAIVN